MNDDLKQYLLSKINQEDPYSQEKYDQAVAQSQDQQSKLALSQLAAGFGDALARRDSGNTDRYFDNKRATIQDSTVGEFKRNKANQISDIKLANEKRTLDPNSQESQSFRKLVETTMPQIAKSYGDKWAKISAADQDSILNFGKMRESFDARRDYQNQNNVIKQEARIEKKNAVLTDVEDRRKNIEDNLNMLEQMIKEKGTYEALGSHNADMNRRVDQIATDMAKLTDPNSVARPSEVDMFKAGLVQPGISMKNSTALDILNNFRKEVNQRAANAYRIRGVDNPTVIGQEIKKQMNEPQKMAKSEGGLITVTDGKETFQIPPEDLEDARKDGFKEVQS